MASFYVLTPPDMTDPEKQTLFVRDGFSWLAFILPLPWMLVRRLWLAAALSLAFYLVAVIVAENTGLDGLPIAYSFVLALWTALEGGQARVRSLQRRGWELKATISAHDVDEAEELYFVDQPKTIAATTPVRMPGANSVPHPSSAVALGLIGPYGGR
jgi:hypothetical protein